MEAEGPESPEDLIAAQYKGSKEHLRPLLDAIVHIARRIDPKVRIEPAASFVRFAKKQPFAVVKAVGKDRVELGLALGEAPITPGLKPCRGLAGEAYVTHKLVLLHLSQVNAQLVIWFKRAYEITGTRSPPKPVQVQPNQDDSAPELDDEMEDDSEPEEPRVPNPPPARKLLKRSSPKAG